MHIDAITYAFVSAAGNTSNSLMSTQVLRSKRLSAGSVTLVSLLPAFLISMVCSIQFWNSLTWMVASLMILKNIFYGSAFYLRFRGLSHLGGFQGALLAACQPVLVSVLSLTFLGEHLLAKQWFAVMLITGALLLPVRFENGKNKDVVQFALLPALLLSLVVVMDRWILVNALNPIAFFVLDKALLFPVVLLTLMISGRYKIRRLKQGPLKSSTVLWILALGLTWALASYTYGVSLAGEKTAIVTLVRNLAFPAAAIGSAFLFNEKLNRSRILSLLLVISACVIAI